MKNIILSLIAFFTFCISGFAQRYDSCFVKKTEKYTYYRIVTAGVSNYYRVSSKSISKFQGFLTNNSAYIEDYFTWKRYYDKVAAPETFIPKEGQSDKPEGSNDVSSGTTWTKEMQRDFLKSRDVAIVVDFSKSKIMGVSEEEFPIYYAGKYNKSEGYASLVLKTVKEYFKDAFREAYSLSVIEEAKAKYVVHYDFYTITENAGASGVFYVMAGSDKSAVINFYWERGKWNEFDVLMKENIQKYFRNASKGIGLSPYFNSTLYK